MTTPDEDGEYLGDGVYATFDGYQVWLHTERDVNVWNTIAIEPETFERLVEYRAKVYRRPDVNSESYLAAQRNLQERLLADSIWEWGGHTLKHTPTGRMHAFTAEEAPDVRRYLEAHKDSPLDSAVLFDDVVYRFGSRNADE